ncbi:kinesin-like nuclear fusion protein [Friedmanniomyces endolithicus]|nr:kinesin-like nuclear fusion protein [Friedmanniomyces endolithicus]KAK0775170.1 kinesin-like nuclear fusion protein [Friedmanniomyces endolithicus]KAK0779435.1 kinesin-like nuclear fusion protein [Friedmanniomyces endolithicus]KAK0782991.1 kinesin-like nuclear fusion protein [Friedmanniomyces endolithicus]KAK0835057.1 kinesin-like nuclear fusion protein [Friedmanniomyces endolithicus]
MERPPSQLENVRPSGLKQPSRLPAMTHSNGRATLLETSQSELNTRHGHHGGPMGPPSTNGPIKHKIPGLPESATKQRRTLIERAAEPLSRSNMPPPPPPSRTNGTRAQLSHGHGRSASAISIPAYTNGVRPESRQRVLSAEEEAEAEAGIMGKRKGTPVMSFNHHLSLRKTRTQGNLRTFQRVRSDGEDSSASERSRYASDGSTSSEELALPARNTSLTSAFADLSLTPHSRHPSAPRHTPFLNGIREEVSPSKIPKFSCAPRLLHAQSTQALQTPSPIKHKSSINGMYTPRTDAKPREMPFFLTKDSLTTVHTAWDTKGRLADMESMYGELRTQVADAVDSKTALEESLAFFKSQGTSKVQELKQLERELTAANRKLIADVERARSDLHTTTTDLRQARRDHERDMQEVERKHDRDLAGVTQKLEKEVDLLSQERERDAERFRKEMEEAKQKWQRQKDDEAFDMGMAHAEELEEVKKRSEIEKGNLQRQVDEWKNEGESRATESASEVQDLRNTISHLQNQLEATNATVTSLRARIAAEGHRNAALEQEKTALVSKTHFLEGNQEAQSFEFTSMRQKLQDAVTAKETTLDTLRREEMLRRKLNATILELRGNIRVFVRIRPLLAGEEEAARVEYPDGEALGGGKELVVHAPTTLSATGKERNEKHSYGFDRVFAPTTANDEVFDACRDLIQSVVDGYNVSILSYGQTGSGKTYGMSGPDGIIPSAISLLLAEMQRLQAKGWEYVVEASFVEVYNEMLNDLLGDAKTWDVVDGQDLGGSVRGKRKERHEIHHDARTGKTTVNNLSSVTLWPPPPTTEGEDGERPPTATSTSEDPPLSQPQDQTLHTRTAVTALLATAAKNRRVAATRSNERSSRSHSIFLLTLRGSCAATGEASEGVLNLVDLAGSERLKVSGAAGERARETAAINRSLAALGDVVAALGSGGGGGGGGKKGEGGEGHVPYRNSKLTYLLQSSLGGTTAGSGKSSRTLMLLHLSPLLAHWPESRSSLLFGSKVHGAHIGAAKKK